LNKENRKSKTENNEYFKDRGRNNTTSFFLFLKSSAFSELNFTLKEKRCWSLKITFVVSVLGERHSSLKDEKNTCYMKILTNAWKLEGLNLEHLSCTQKIGHPCRFPVIGGAARGGSGRVNRPEGLLKPLTYHSGL
jgi:hypothetical protein